MSIPSPREGEDETLGEEPQVFSTANGKEDGLDDCARCGSSEVTYRESEGVLTCLHCRHSWQEKAAVELFGLNSPIQDLSGTHLGSGAQAITQAESVVTLKCGGCGAEVTIDSAVNLQARCHWCRQTLSLNEQVPNGAVPDAVLPFKLSRDEAVAAIRTFAGKREFFAAKQFRAEFKPENVVGVFLPYMLIDANVEAELSGRGEIQTRRYKKKVGDNEVTVYDADVYDVARAFSFTVDDLTVEASSEKAHMDSSVNSHNVINTILPFDTKEAVSYNSNYLGSYTSEKRDLDMKSMQPQVLDQLLSIARSEGSKFVQSYGRGVRWEEEYVEVKGSRWISLYLPVWLYSYMEESNGSKFIHYIAVNGRTGETMGSVPVNKVRLGLVSTAVGLVSTVAIGIALLVSGAFGDGASDYEPYPPSYSYEAPR